MGIRLCRRCFWEARCGRSYKSREPFGIDEYVGDTDLAVRRPERGGSAALRAAVSAWRYGGRGERAYGDRKEHAVQANRRGIRALMV